MEYHELVKYQLAIEDCSEAIRLKPDYAGAYNNRGLIYLDQGNIRIGCSNVKKACDLGTCNAFESAKGRSECL
jgi:tetratricopeptide (TPR) repeat protein